MIIDTVADSMHVFVQLEVLPEFTPGHSSNRSRTRAQKRTGSNPSAFGWMGKGCAFPIHPNVMDPIQENTSGAEGQRGWVRVSELGGDEKGRAFLV